MTFVESFPKTSWLSLKALQKLVDFHWKFSESKLTFIEKSPKAGWLLSKAPRKTRPMSSSPPPPPLLILTWQPPYPSCHYCCCCPPPPPPPRPMSPSPPPPPFSSWPGSLLTSNSLNSQHTPSGEVTSRDSTFDQKQPDRFLRGDKESKSKKIKVFSDVSHEKKKNFYLVNSSTSSNFEICSSIRLLLGQNTKTLNCKEPHISRIYQGAAYHGG